MIPALPREHGAWAWLLLPLVAGVGTSHSISPPLVLYPAAVVLGYLARGPAEAWVRSGRRSDLLWTAVLALAAVAAGAPAVVAWGRWWLLPGSALVATGPLMVMSTRRFRTAWRVPGELLVVASLALLAGVTRYASDGALSFDNLRLWLPVALYGGASVFYVRMLFHSRRRPSLRSDPAVPYHLGLVLVLAVAAALEAIPPLVGFAFLPLLMKVVWTLGHPPQRVRPITTGLLESAHAALFAALLIAAYRLS